MQCPLLIFMVIMWSMFCFRPLRWPGGFHQWQKLVQHSWRCWHGSHQRRIGHQQQFWFLCTRGSNGLTTNKHHKVWTNSIPSLLVNLQYQCLTISSLDNLVFDLNPTKRPEQRHCGTELNHFQSRSNTSDVIKDDLCFKSKGSNS